MPRILRIINRFNLGGPTYNAAYLTKYMEPEFETLLIGGVHDDEEDSSEYIVRNLGIRPFIIPEMRREISPANDLIAYNKIRNIIKRFKPDIVHTHASKAGILGRKAAFNCNVPVVVHTFHGHVFHSYFNSYKSKAFQKIEQQLAKKTTRIIAVSDKQREELSDTYNIAPANNIEVVPLGFDLSRFHENMDEKRRSFRKDYMIEDDEVAVGIIGRLAPIKNHDMFINAIHKVINTTDKRVRVFIVGDGENREILKKKATELGIDFACNGECKKRRVTLAFTSWIKEVDWVYAGLDIVALTSLNEGTPVSLIEAQASNTPIVSTNVGGIENIVIPGETAILTRNGNLDDFTDKLMTVIHNDELREKLAVKGWDYVHERFHYTTLINNMKSFYHELLNN
ncbi:MAG: glycosyltransferase [Bacteroidota bacterium]